MFEVLDMRYQLRLDYATFNFVKGTESIESISQKLLGSNDLCWTKKGLNENSPVYSPLGLRYLDNSGFEASPHKLEVSGVGCEHFAATLPALRDRDNSHFSRVDFAFDVVMPRSQWREFIKTAFCASLDSQRKAKRFRLTGDGEAMTIYIGSRKGAKFFRIYNKTLQDKKYQFYDADLGQDVEVSESDCVIRYEVELHRHKVVSNSEIRLFDPSPLFDWYYSDDAELREKLYDTIKTMWCSFGSEDLLPSDFFNSAEFESRILNKNKNFASKSDGERLQIVRDNLHDYPHTFDHTLQYVAEKFGRYIPYLLVDPDYRRFCFDACRLSFGFVPDLIIESTPQGFYDLDDLDESDESDEIKLPWNELVGEQSSIDDISYL